MPLSLPSVIAQEKNKLASAGAWILLLEMHVIGVGVIKVCRNTEDIEWNGDVWTAFPFEVDARTVTSRGRVPELVVRVGNVNRIMQSYVEQANGAIGSKVILRVVHSEHLDVTEPALEEEFVVTDVQCDAYWVQCTLSIPNPMLYQFPKQKYLKNYCRWRFKSVECGYDGNDTSCGKTLEDCRAKGNAHRFGGFPGIPVGGVW